MIAVICLSSISSEPIRPRNNAVLRGNTVSLPCSWYSFKFTIQWYESISSGDGSERLLSINGDIVDGHPWQADYRVTHEDQYNLRITNIETTFAGTYKCNISGVVDDQYESMYAELIVLCEYETICVYHV